MALLTLEGSLRLVQTLAKQAAPPGDEELYAEEGADWVHDVFSSVRKNNQSVEAWSSVEPQVRVLSTAEAYGYFRVDLRRATERYVNEMPWLHCRAFNWLLANLLLHAEVSASLSTWGYSNRWRDGKLNWQLLALKMVWGLFIWGLWVVILVALVIVEWPWAAVAWIVLTAIRQVLIWRERSRRNRLVSSMIDTYHSTNSMGLSWNIVWDALKKSRDLGAVWDQELYQLVETVKAKSLA